MPETEVHRCARWPNGRIGRHVEVLCPVLYQDGADALLGLMYKSWQVCAGKTKTPEGKRRADRAKKNYETCCGCVGEAQR